MGRFVEGEDRQQPTLLPRCLDDYVSEDNPAQVIDVFVDELDLGELGFAVTPAAPLRRTPACLVVYGEKKRTVLRAMPKAAEVKAAARRLLE
jgi:hypothetical protein